MAGATGEVAPTQTTALFVVQLFMVGLLALPGDAVPWPATFGGLAKHGCAVWRWHCQARPLAAFGQGSDCRPFVLLV